MALALVVARLVLAALFAVAGIAKLVDGKGSREAVRGFGVPASLVAATAIVLPLLELGLAVALVPPQSVRLAAAGASGLLGLFSVLIVVAVMRGRNVDCHCFGQLHSAPAGWRVAGRNVVLAVVAMFVASQSGVAVGWVEVAAAAGIGAVAAQALLLFILLRRYGRALVRVDELSGARGSEIAPAGMLERGSVAPGFELADVVGDRISLGRLSALGRPVLLVFSSSGCGACHALLPRVAEWQRQRSDSVTVAVIASGDRAGNAALAEEHDLSLVLLQDRDEVAQLYGITATPSAVLVGADGAILHALVAGAGAVEDLVEAVAPAAASSSKVPLTLEAAPVTAPGVLAGSVAGVAVTAGATSLGVVSAAASPLADPDLEQVAAAMRRAGPLLTAATHRSSAAVRAQAVLRDGKAQRARRTAAVRALAAERRVVLAHRSELGKLDLSSSTAANTRAIALVGLALVARSLEQRRKAVVAPPKVAAKLLDQAQKTYLSALVSLADAAKIMGGG